MKIDRKLHKIDATDKVLGRLGVEVAVLLRGRHKVDFIPYIDNGDIVEVFNLDKVKVKGDNKLTDKMYHRYSGYPGGIKSVSLKDYLAKNPQELLKEVVYGMLPKNKTRDIVIKRLRFI